MAWFFKREKFLPERVKRYTEFITPHKEKRFSLSPRRHDPHLKKEYTTLVTTKGVFSFKNPPAPVESVIHVNTPVTGTEVETTSKNSLLSSGISDFAVKEVYATLPILLELDVMELAQCLESVPVFLRTFYYEGSLNSDILCNISKKLESSFLQLFLTNLSDETTYFLSLMTLKTLDEYEFFMKNQIKLCHLCIWRKNENFLFSTTDRRGVTVNDSILGYFSKSEEDFFGDIFSHRHFNLLNDIPLFDSTLEHSILPIRAKDETVALLVASANSISQYVRELLKISRQFMERMLENNTALTTVPSVSISKCGVAPLGSVSICAKVLSSVISDTLNCDLTEFFEFDERKMELLLLNDGSTYTSETGGFAFKSAEEMKMISFAHNPHLHLEHIDSRFTNKSVLAASFFFSKHHYVIVCRSKRGAHSFSIEDQNNLIDISSVCLELIDVSVGIQQQEQERQKLRRLNLILTSVSDTLQQIARKGTDHYLALKLASRSAFGSSDVLVSWFDGKYMRFFQKNIAMEFESCVSGVAYNYRKLVLMNVSVNPHLFNDELYKSLGLLCNHSFAFPYKIGAKYVGAVEIVNPTDTVLELECQHFFANLVTFLLSKDITFEMKLKLKK